VTPERTAELVARWVRFYTRNLPPPIAERRTDEIDADLHDHIAHERAHGSTDSRLALSIAARMVRGLAADASWRRHTMAHHSNSQGLMRMFKPAHRIALATAFVVLLPLVAMLFTDEVDWGVFDFVSAAALVAGAGVLLELAVKRPSKIAYLIAAGTIGAAAIVLGEADDAPGLMLFGGLLILGTVALAVRTAVRSD
jgi:hypothetical protein